MDQMIYSSLAIAFHCAIAFLFYLLLQMIKNRIIKKLTDWDFKSIAKFFNRSNSGIICGTVYDIADRRLCNAGDITDFIDCQITLAAKKKDPF